MASTWPDPVQSTENNHRCGARTILIGDIHGCYDEFEQLLHEVRFNVESDRLVLLGDLMDRGKDSCKVFHKARELKAAMGSRCVVLKGSHEKFLLDPSLRLKDRVLWRIIGKGAALKSFKRHNEQLEACVEWFREHAVLFYELPQFQCVHAGIREENLFENNEHTLLMDHGIVRKNLYRGKLTITGHIHLKEPTWFDGFGDKGQILPYHKWMRLPQTGVICIDTGCAEGNKLTAFVVCEDHFCLYSQKNK